MTYEAGANAVLSAMTILVTSLPKLNVSICLSALVEAEAVAVKPPAGAVGGGAVHPPPPPEDGEATEKEMARSVVVALPTASWQRM